MINYVLNFDPLLSGGKEQARTYFDKLYEHLSTNGVLTELGEYPLSPHYAWVRGRSGITWQLILINPAGEPRPFILPSSIFGDTNHASAEEATETWIVLFDDARRDALRHYGEGRPIETEVVTFIDFTLRDTWTVAMDPGVFYDFTFTSGVSTIVSCRDQAEVDRYWAGLSAVPKAEHCGRYVGRWDVSWQIVPRNIAKLMAGAATREKPLRMGKIGLVDL